MVQYWDHQQQIFSFLDAGETPIFSIKETININQTEKKKKNEKFEFYTKTVRKKRALHIDYDIHVPFLKSIVSFLDRVMFIESYKFTGNTKEIVTNTNFEN